MVLPEHDLVQEEVLQHPEDAEAGDVGAPSPSSLPGGVRCSPTFDDHGDGTGRQAPAGHGEDPERQDLATHVRPAPLAPHPVLVQQKAGIDVIIVAARLAGTGVQLEHLVEEDDQQDLGDDRRRSATWPSSGWPAGRLRSSGAPRGRGVELVHNGPMLGGADGDQVVDRPGRIGHAATPKPQIGAGGGGRATMARWNRPRSTSWLSCSTSRTSRSTCSGASARRSIAAGVRRPGGRPGARRRRPHRRAGPRHPLAARLLPPPRRPDGADPLRGGPAARRAQRSPPAGWWPSSTAGRSSTCRRRSTSPSRASTTRSRCPPTCHRPDSLDDFATRWAPFKDAAGRLVHPPRPIDTRYADWSPPDRAEPLPPHAPRLGAGQRRAARRSGPARVRARLPRRT